MRVDKVLIIIPDNNKGKFIAKGFACAFKELSYFVFEKKIYDLTLEEAQNISPNIIFIFWTDITQKEKIEHILSEYKNEKTIFMHCSESGNDIPESINQSKQHYIFTYNSKNKSTKFHTSVNPKDYKVKFKGYNYNITFSGNPSLANREYILSKLIYNFGSISVFCRSFDFYKSVEDIYKSALLDDKLLELYRKSYKGYSESTEELAKIYSSSKINIDMAGEYPENVNYRCMEITASGGFLIAPYSKNICRYFENFHEIETYNNADELVDKIRFYLNNLNIAGLIADKGKKNTVSNHSFYDRLKLMLKEIYGKDISSR